MISFIWLLYDIYRGRQYAKTVAPYDFGPPGSAQAWKSYCIWRKSLGKEIHAKPGWDLS